MAKIFVSDELGGPSAAQLYFDSLRRSEDLFPWIFRQGRFPGYSERDLKNIYSVIYKAVTRPQRILYRSIFLLREYVHPSLWFCTAEKMSSLKKTASFVPSHPFSASPTLGTLGTEALNRIRESHGLLSYSRSSGVEYAALVHYCGNNSQIRNPTTRDIFLMRKDISPEDWFIFSDELRRNDALGAVTPAPVVKAVRTQEKRDIEMFRRVISEDVTKKADKKTPAASCEEFLLRCYRTAAEMCGIADMIDIFPCGVYTSVVWKDGADAERAGSAEKEFYSLARVHIGRAPSGADPRPATISASSASHC